MRKYSSPIYPDRIAGQDLIRKSAQPLKFRPARVAVRLLLLSLALAVVCTVLTWIAIRRCDPQDAPTTTPKSATELAVFLREKLPKARIISTRSDGQIDRSFILTIGDLDDSTLRSLPRVSNRAGEWQGTVLCECLVNWETADLFLEQWGDHAFARPPFVFFGDKELLAQIEEALR